MSYFRKIIMFNNSVNKVKNFIRANFSHNYPGNAVTMDNTAKNTIVIIFSGIDRTSGSFPVPTASDTQGNVYQTFIKSDSSGSNAGLGPTIIGFSYATNIVGGSGNVITVSFGSLNIGTDGADIGVTAIEYSGITALDTYNFGSVNASPTTVTVNTSDTDMFISVWALETVGFTNSTNSLNGIAATTVAQDTSHYDAEYEWLNSAKGFPKGTYTYTETDSLTEGSPLLALLAFK